MIFWKKDDGENKNQDENKENDKHHIDGEILKVAAKFNPWQVL